MEVFQTPRSNRYSGYHCKNTHVIGKDARDENVGQAGSHLKKLLLMYLSADEQNNEGGNQQDSRQVANIVYGY